MSIDKDQLLADDFASWLEDFYGVLPEDLKDESYDRLFSEFLIDVEFAKEIDDDDRYESLCDDFCKVEDYVAELDELVAKLVTRVETLERALKL